MFLKHYTWGEKLAVLAAFLFLLVALYRLAVVFELIPPEWRPEGVILLEYHEAKIFLAKKASGTGMLASMSKGLLHSINGIEQQIKERKAAMDRSDEVAKRCNENQVFRFFMTVGQDQDPNKCVKQNMRVEQELRNDAK